MDYRKILSRLFFGLGWLLLIIFIGSSYFLSKLTHHEEGVQSKGISWKQHSELFDGIIQCSMIGEDLQARKEELKVEVFSKLRSKEKTANSYTYYFDNDDELLKNVIEHLLIEKECCPFFKFDLSILPFDRGFAFQLSGSEAAMEMIESFEGVE